MYNYTRKYHTCEYNSIGVMDMTHCFHDQPRAAELRRLNEMYGSGKFEFAIIYGRRRVGKTALIRRFLEGKRAVYFSAREADGAVNLNGFSTEIYRTANPALSGKSFFPDWEKALDYLHEISKDERIILAIDEYPYLAAADRSIASVLQAHIDAQFKDGRLFLILCGSSMSFMEEEVLGYKSPLYGRRTAQFKVLPFTFFDSLPFFAGYSPIEQAVLYGITGGIPEYLLRIDSNKTVRENIIDQFLTPSGHFYEEPVNLLKQELREPSTYNTIIEAIAGGASRLNEIATKAHTEPTKCAKYLRSLMALGLIKKEHPVTESGGKRSIYRIDDMMFRFWYRFVFSNVSAIQSLLGESVYDYEIAPDLNTYMGLVFEEICRQFMWKLMQKNALPFFTGNLGRWWGNNPAEKRQEEIDLLAFRENKAIFGECKWTEAPVDIDVLIDLQAQSRLFRYEENTFFLFAKNGFTNRLAEMSSDDPFLKLYTLADMIAAV